MSKVKVRWSYIDLVLQCYYSSSQLKAISNVSFINDMSDIYPRP